MKIKHIVSMILLLAAVSCDSFDDSAIWDELQDHKERIEKLEEMCNQLNANVSALQTILDALQQKDYVTDITRIMEDGVEIGYSITFARKGTVTIYHGSDGNTPQIGIRKASDGEYYWTSDGEWMTDENGEKIPAAGQESIAEGEYVTPQFRVDNGSWYVSYDNGHTWRVIGNLGECEEPVFEQVTYDDEYIYFTLSDGTQLKVPIGVESRVVDLFIFMGQSNMVGRGVAAEAPAVPEGWAYEYKAISQPDKLSPVVEPFGLDEENSSSGVVDNRRSGSLVSAFMNAYYEQTKTPVVGVSCSKGGTTTSFWGVGGKPLNDAISRYNQAEEWLTDNGYVIRHKYMFWLQGETDAKNNLAAETYRSNMISIVKEMISKTSVEKCMMIRVGKLGQTVTSAFTICDDIIEVQTDLCRTYKEFVMASTAAAGFVEDGLMAEYWHYTQEGYNILGEHTGINVAFYANNGIEPYMYDPHTDGLYYPVTKYKSVFDESDETDEEEEVVPEYDFSNTTWYVNHTANASKFTNSCNVAGRGWAIAASNSIYKQLIGKPINTAAFFTNKTSQTVTVMKVPYKGATAGEVIATVTATIPSATKQLAVITFPDVTLAEGEYLSLFSQEASDIQFYYATMGVNESVTGALDNGFNSRLPVLYGSGTSWSESAMSLGWSFGYTEPPTMTYEKVALVGDSITSGVGASDKSQRYSTLLASKLGAQEVNLGVSGTVLCTGGHRTANIGKLTADNLSDADLVLVKMGINDWDQAKASDDAYYYDMGTKGTDDTSTLYGAMDAWCKKIEELRATERYSKTEFYFITPVITSWNSSVGVRTYDQSKTNIHGFTLRDLCEVIIDVCSDYDIPVLDMNQESGIYYHSEEYNTVSLYFGDGVHPNDAGHAILAESIYEALLARHISFE